MASINRNMIEKLFGEHADEVNQILDVLIDGIHGQKTMHVAMALPVLMAYCIDTSEDKIGVAQDTMDIISSLVSFDEPPWRKTEREGSKH